MKPDLLWHRHFNFCFQTLHKLHEWFVLQRPLGHYMFDLYLPAICIVFMSWINFWLTRYIIYSTIHTVQYILYSIRIRIILIGFDRFEADADKQKLT
jgi:hypothetical protein